MEDENWFLSEKEYKIQDLHLYKRILYEKKK